MQSKVSRRQLIAAGAVGAAVAATTSAAQAASKKPQFDKVYDVIVVGSGFAGLAAADLPVLDLALLAVLDLATSLTTSLTASFKLLPIE